MSVGRTCQSSNKIATIRYLLIISGLISPSFLKCCVMFMMIKINKAPGLALQRVTLVSACVAGPGHGGFVVINSFSYIAGSVAIKRVSDASLFVTDAKER